MEQNASMESTATDVGVDQDTLEKTVKLKLMSARANLVRMEVFVLMWLLATNATAQEATMDLDANRM